MKKFAVVLLAAGTLSMFGAVAIASADPAPNITICHRTDSATNPYVQITVDASSVDGDLGNNTGQGDHFAEHVGPLASSEAVAQALKDAHTEWGDIIPPIAGVHGGLNWTAEGQAMFNNGCGFVVTTTTTTTSTPPTTTTQPPVTSTTATTATTPGTTTTQATTTTTPVSVAPNTSSSPPKQDSTKVVKTPAEAAPLAFTGIEDVVPLIGIALAMMTTGSGMLWASSRRKDRTPPRPDL